MAAQFLKELAEYKQLSTSAHTFYGVQRRGANYRGYVSLPVIVDWKNWKVVPDLQKIWGLGKDEIDNSIFNALKYQTDFFDNRQ